MPVDNRGSDNETKNM